MRWEGKVENTARGLGPVMFAGSNSALAAAAAGAGAGVGAGERAGEGARAEAEAEAGAGGFRSSGLPAAGGDLAVDLLLAASASESRATNSESTAHSDTTKVHSALSLCKRQNEKRETAGGNCLVSCPWWTGRAGRAPRGGRPQSCPRGRSLALPLSQPPPSPLPRPQPPAPLHEHRRVIRSDQRLTVSGHGQHKD